MAVPASGLPFPHLLAGDVARGDESIISHEDESGEQFLDRCSAIRAPRQQRCGLQIELEKICVFSDFEAASGLIHRQRPRSAECCEVPELERSERNSLYLLHLVRI